MRGIGRKVYVNARDYCMSVQVAIISGDSSGEYIDWYNSETGTYTRVPLNEGSIIPKPTIEFRYDDAVELYRELHKFFSDRGVKNKDESYMGGELDGTKRHLSDLRHLLKLPPNPQA